MQTYLVAVRYRTKSGLRERTWLITAADLFAAVTDACDRQRRQRGVVKVDGGRALGLLRNTKGETNV